MKRAAGRVHIARAAGSDEAEAGSTCIRTWRALNAAERGYSQQYATAAEIAYAMKAGEVARTVLTFD